MEEQKYNKICKRLQEIKDMQKIIKKRYNISNEDFDKLLTSQLESQKLEKIVIVNNQSCY